LIIAKIVIDKKDYKPAVTLPFIKFIATHQENKIVKYIKLGCFNF